MRKAALSGGLALVLSASPAWGADAGLFLPLSAADAALFARPAVSPAPSAGGALGEGRAPANGWLVRVDRRRLFRTIHGVARQGAGNLALNVAEGLQFDFVVERAQRTLSGHSLSGRLEGVAGSAVTFVAHAEVVMGTVWTPKAAYEVAPFKDGVHVFREVDGSARPRLAEPIRVEGGWGDLSPTEQADADGGSVVDVLVVYTPKAQENAGGEAPMRAGVDLAVAYANDAHERSGAEVRLNLVGAERVDYVEHPLSDCDREFGCRSATDLTRLANPSDGFMDGVHGRRDALGADLVSLFTGDGDVGGIAHCCPGSFSVVLAYEDWSSYGVGSVFAHELGHNMGLSHDRYQVLGLGDEGLFPFSYGYVNKLAFEPGAAQDDCWVTIMSYHDRCYEEGGFGVSFEVPYFSTPDRRYPDDGTYPDGEGPPLGVPKESDDLGADGPADAVRALNLTLPRVVNFRPGRGDDGDTADAATPVVATSTTFATLEARDDIDYFRIELPEAGWLRAETTGYGALRGELIAEDGALIAEDDDGGEGLNFLIEAELEAGVYFIKVDVSALWLWNDPMDYALVVSFSPASAADDHGDVAANATAVALPSSTAGELENASDTDRFRFEVAERGLVRLGTTGATDVVGALVSEDGTLRLVDDDGGAATNFQVVAKLDPGVYFVAVTGFAGDSTGPYTLDLSFSPLSEAPDDHADFPGRATHLAVGSSVAGELEALLDSDHFRIEVPGVLPGLLWVESKGGTDVKGALLKLDGDRLAAHGFGGEDRNFVLGAHVAPGSYVLRVEGEFDAVGAYELGVSFTADGRAVPLFVSASHPTRHGFARIVNRSDRAGAVAIHAIDDAGEWRGPATLSLAAGQTAHFNSGDLEMGNPTEGLSGGVGVGEGDWRLELATNLDIEALAYVRTADGFLTGMNEVATYKADGYWEEVAATFNPASNRAQASKLRLINPGPSSRFHFWLQGRDDGGESGEGSVFFSWQWAWESGASRTIDAQSLEAGGGRLQGHLGEGDGKWRLRLFAPWPVRAMSLLESPTGHLTNLTGRAARIGRRAALPLFVSASDPAREGFARIISRDQRSGTVHIHAIDDAGRRRGPVSLSLGAGKAMHFNSEDLEAGNPAKGLSGGLGAGEGHWRLELDADVDIEALAYMRTPDGFLTGMNALAPKRNGRIEVVFFNPASNERQVSRLRLVNPADADATLTITGMDDAGEAPPEGAVTLTVPAGAAAEITAQQLEAGADHFDGRFGDGKGKWRLFIEADQDIQAMSLLESPTGHIANLSAGTAVR